MGVRHQLKNLLERMKEEDPDTDVEIYPGVNQETYEMSTYASYIVPLYPTPKPNWDRDV